MPITLSSQHFQLKEEVRHSISTVPHTQSSATFIAMDHPIDLFPHVTCTNTMAEHSFGETI